MSVTSAAPTPTPLADIRATFVRALPRIRAHARYALRRGGRIRASLRDGWLLPRD